jgi:uncharacterized membrane protein
LIINVTGNPYYLWNIIDAKKMTTEHPFKSTALRFGFYLALSLIIVFMLMKALELNGTLAYRLIDIVLIYFFVGRSQHFYQTHSFEDGHGYLRNMGLAVVTSFFGLLIFALFLYTYLSFMNEGYLNFLKEILPMGEHLNPTIIAVFILIEGVAVGALSGFIQALYIKNPTL